MQGEIWLAANYVLTVCSDEVMAQIMRETNASNPAEAVSLYKGHLRSQMRRWEGHNLVPSILRNSFATLISGTTVTPTFKANYIALGDDSAAPANTDTKLWNETIRRLFTDRRAIDNIAYLDKNFGSVEVWGNTYNEIWVFVDGTSTADTGYLLSRININQTMQALENLTINVTITII